MKTVFLAQLSELNALVGRTVDAFFQDANYWHMFVALRCTDGQTIVFNTEDVSIAKYFEVFPIKVKVEPTEQRAWKSLVAPKTIRDVMPLFRDEWLEPSAPNPDLFGSAPHHVHHAGLGPAPASAVQQTTVLAGVELGFSSSDLMLIYASNNAPFNVEIAVSQAEVESALGGFNTPAT
ncbi:MAG: hypothetical protein H7172_06560 [Ferruginibacter sp.]|nr:hypothetical protein [Rhodoferax sp.]